MKFGSFLTEFDKSKNTVLKIGRTLPHMISAQMDTSAENVAKFVNAPVDEVQGILTKVKQVAGNPKLSPEVHKALAVACYLRNRSMKQSQTTKQLLEELSGMPYDQLYQLAVTNLPDMQKELESFRLSWFTPIVSRQWKEIPNAEKKAMIVQTWDVLSHGGSQVVSAQDLASSMLRSGQIEVKDPDSLRKAIDRFLSSNDPEAVRMNLRRPIGKTDRGPVDIGSATVIPYRPNR